MMLFILLCVTVLIQPLFSQNCPVEEQWQKYNRKCYKLFFSQMTRFEATDACQLNGATLLSLNDDAEHNFVENLLKKEDSRRDDWLTSGVVTETGDLFWNGDGTARDTVDEWSPDLKNRWDREEKNLMSVVYTYIDGEYKWTVHKKSDRLPFICEIDVNEVYRIGMKPRDFDYGVDVGDPSLAERGPKFITEPEKTVILERTRQVFFECIAAGNPEPTYKWYFVDSQGRSTPLSISNPKYTITTGRLSISNPEEVNEGKYKCEASNKFGKIISADAELSFGSLGSFTNVPSAAVRGIEHQGVNIQCPDITGKPGISYNWYKNTPATFVRPNNQIQSFISSNGKLYFSELATSDDATYYCIANWRNIGSTSNFVGGFQPPSKTSIGFKLNVIKGTAKLINPIIQNEFIYINPTSPQRGNIVQLECLAYGTGPLVYSWKRIGADMPLKRHSFASQNRILTIRNVELVDEGRYECTVRSSRTGGQATKSTDLLVQSKPYFIYNLNNQHVDIDSYVTLHCEAAGRPRATYFWLKDGEPLQSSPGVLVSRNTIIIEKITLEHSGMYQCGAVNDHGTSYSSGQLRVLQLPPSFEKNPMEDSVSAAAGGNVNLFCNPIGAPRPTLSWLKDGSDLGLTPGIYNEDDKVKMRLNGILHISDISSSDQGTYTCRAENTIATAEDSTILRILDSTTMSKTPVNERVTVNLTATFLCQASHPPEIEMVYQWKFFDHVIDFEKEPQYQLGSGSLEGALYIRDAQYEYAGLYTCSAITSLDTFSSSAYLTVMGPPSEPAGVDIRDFPLEMSLGAADESLDFDPATTRWLVWVDGDDHFSQINLYSIQFMTTFDTEWRNHPVSPVLVSDTLVDNDKYTNQNLRQVRIVSLKAGVSISFRVIAWNSYGRGAPSLPTEFTTIPEAKPTVAVTNVRGGGGSEGDLTILWDPLPREDHNGLNLKYIVQWRQYTRQNSNNQWRNITVSHNDACRRVPDFKTGLIYICQYVDQVGTENFYKEYEAQITTKNNVGEGPTSQIAVVRSAEGMPSGTPEKVQSEVYNSTALMITWLPVPNTRQAMQGKLKGYKINYWRMNIDVETQALQNIIELKPNQGNLDRGLIIGLEPVTWYTFNVQAYNSAGNGPKSSDNFMQTLNRVPKLFPTEVHVFSVDGIGVRVTFRGISTRYREEPLQGYKVQYWKSKENILSAKEADFGKTTTGVIRNISTNDIYQLRVFGYSRGGQGARSSPPVFFTVGEGEILINPEFEEVMGTSSVNKPVYLLLILTSILAFCVRQ